MTHISGRGRETFHYINGIGVRRKLQLGDGVELWPARCQPEPDDVIKVSKNEVDIGIAAIFLRQVKSQLRVTASDPKALAVAAWNSLWDCVLLSALHDCESVCNFQCNKPAEGFNAKCKLEVTNYYLRGFGRSVHMINKEESIWIEKHFQAARNLLEEPEFQNAVHCMATFRWHAHPRPRLALIWSGIEGLFNIESEVVFRLSLYISRFLSLDNRDEMRTIFSQVKRLYKQRSVAVHGSKKDKGLDEAVIESAQLLKTLIKRCVEAEALPKVEELAP